LNKNIYIRLVTINYRGENLSHNLLLSRAFSVGIPLTVGFRPQEVVVSGLSVGIPLTVGFRPQLVVVSGLSVGIPLTVGF
jgi:predicted membrane protein